MYAYHIHLRAHNYRAHTRKEKSRTKYAKNQTTTTAKKEETHHIYLAIDENKTTRLIDNYNKLLLVLKNFLFFFSFR
jgi:hypothetical protein